MSAMIRASKARSEFKLISSVQSKVLEHLDVPPIASSAWRKPISGSLKINCDVAVPMGSAKATAAMVLPNDPGEIIDGSTSSFFHPQSYMGNLEQLERRVLWVSS